MADRITQLQEAVNAMASAFSDSIGIVQNEIQRGATADEIDDCTKQYSQNISSIVNDIKLLIKALPDDNKSFQEDSIEYIEDQKESFHKDLEMNYPAYTNGCHLEQILSDTNRTISGMSDILVKLKHPNVDI